MKQEFEQLPHTADIKMRVYGKTLNELFKNAVCGMFQLIRPITSSCTRQNGITVCRELPERHRVTVNALDLEMLLVDFLSEALYLSDVHNEAYLDAEIHEFDERHIVATLCGVKISGFEVVEIKAVTHHDLHIKKHNGQWRVDIVFDI